MLHEAINNYRNLPNIWGEGALFAFSGIDGETCVKSGFVATYGAKPYNLLIHTPRRRELTIELPDGGNTRVALGDVFGVATPTGDLIVTYSAWHTLVGIVPDNTRLALGFEDEAAYEGVNVLSQDEEHHDALLLLVNGSRFALSYGTTADEARARATEGIKVDIRRTVDERLAYLSQVPSLENATLDRLLKKCASIFKVNTCTAEGAIKRTWSTPDRVPHRDMWLWDSVFHSLAMNDIDPELSWSFLASILDIQKEDGMVPHQNSITGKQSNVTQPPILAWGIWENYQALQDRAKLAYALPKLEAYLEWDLANRDQNDNGLLEWFIEGNPFCRSGESGMDNSPRFDAAATLDAVDFSAFAAHDMACLANIAHELGEETQAVAWHERATDMANRIHEAMWDPDTGFYYDLDMDGAYTGVQAESGFLPLLLDGAGNEQVQTLVAALNDPQRFGTAFPVPSAAVCEPTYSTDMWRGATWLNFNLLIIRGLEKYGRHDTAATIAGKTLAYVIKYYEKYGVIFEFYDSQDARTPPECDRKGPRVEPYNIRRKMDSIRDYHWSAAVTYILLREGYQPAKLDED